MLMRRYIKLVETMNAAQVLLEDRIDFIKANMLPRLIQAVDSKTIAIPANLLPKINAEPGDTLADKLLAYVFSVDPDPAKSNTQWLLTQILRKTNAMPLEDLEYAQETLAQFAEMKRTRQIAKTDINKFKSLSELTAAMRGEQQQVVSADAQYEQQMRQQSRILLDDAAYLVVAPKTQEAARFWGRETAWCTAWGDPHGMYPTRTSYYDTYASQGPLYIVVVKATGAKFQFHQPSGQYMDKDDRQINVQAFLAQNPEVSAVFEAMDGKPIAQIGKYPTYAFGHGFIVKDRGGLFGKTMLVAKVDDDKRLVGLTEHEKADASFWADTEVAALLNKLAITGDPKGEDRHGLYYRDGVWGPFEHFARKLASAGGGIWRFLKVTGGADYAWESEKGQIGANLRDGVINFRTQVTPAVYSAPVLHLLLSEPAITAVSEEGNVQARKLLPEEAQTLVAQRPELADLLTLYTAEKDSERVRGKVEEWLTGQRLLQKMVWVTKDRFEVLRWDKGVDEVVEDIGDDGAKYVVKIGNGEGDLEFYGHYESDSFENYVRGLDAATREKLGNWLKQTYPDEVEENFGDEFDPASWRDIAGLQEEVRDDDLEQATTSADDDGQRVGYENEAISRLKSELNSSEFLYFVEDGKFEGQLKSWDSPIVAAVTVMDVINILRDNKGDEESAAADIESQGWADVFDIKIEVRTDYIDDFDSDSAKERFADQLAEVIGN